MDILSLLSNGLAVALIIGGAAFLAGKVWPYLVERDHEERARRYDVDILQAQAQIDAIKAQQALSQSIVSLATVMQACLSLAKQSAP